MIADAAPLIYADTPLMPPPPIFAPRDAAAMLPPLPPPPLFRILHAAVTSASTRTARLPMPPLPRRRAFDAAYAMMPLLCYDLFCRFFTCLRRVAYASMRYMPPPRHISYGYAR